MSLRSVPPIATLCLCTPPVKPAATYAAVPRVLHSIPVTRRPAISRTAGPHAGPARGGTTVPGVELDHSLASISLSTRMVARRASLSRLSSSRRSAKAPAPASRRRSSCCSDAAFRRSRSPSRSHRSSSRAPAVSAARWLRISASSMNCRPSHEWMLTSAEAGLQPIRFHFRVQEGAPGRGVAWRGESGLGRASA